MFTSFGLLDFGAPELIIILVIILLLFGGKKLPELSKSIGESIREVKNAATGADDLHKELKTQVDDIKTSINAPASKKRNTAKSKAKTAKS